MCSSVKTSGVCVCSGVKDVNNVENVQLIITREREAIQSIANSVASAAV